MIPRASETEIRNAILDYLRIRGYVCKRNNAGYIFLKGLGGKKRAINVGEAGWPDIEGMTHLGAWFGIEVKTEKGSFTPAQIIMQKRIQDSRGIYVVARSVDDVIEAGF